MLNISVANLQFRLRTLSLALGAAAVVIAGLLSTLATPNSVADAGKTNWPAQHWATTPTTSTPMVATPAVVATPCAKRATFPCDK